MTKGKAEFGRLGTVEVRSEGGAQLEGLALMECCSDMDGAGVWFMAGTGPGADAWFSSSARMAESGIGVWVLAGEGSGGVRRMAIGTEDGGSWREGGLAGWTWEGEVVEVRGILGDFPRIPDERFEGRLK
ncbi:hypothetical protein MRB53_023148 [Persea americana]|uniref:Uncharacterized protein n=1 Tax=Persea americana TaxID=3435 RepID=A0ACC2L989_PERAE|nr:hypothetical protein MRB53_023148 [Persea americana]